MYSIYRSSNNVQLAGLSFDSEGLRKALANEFFEGLLDDDLFEYIVQNLSESSIISIDEDPFAGIYYEVTQRFDELYGNRSNDEGVPLGKTHKYGPEWMEKAVRKIFSDQLESKKEKDANEQEVGGIPSVSDNDFWEPLPLERESDGYTDAVSKVEEAYSAILGNNGYAESDPDERNRIVWSIKVGLDQIKDGLPSKNQVREMLIKPLAYIGEKFAGASTGELAKAAVKALWAWITSS